MTLKIVADLHIHSTASGHAYSTLKEIVKAAAEKQLQMIAITDHGPSMPGAPHAYHFGNLHVLPPKICGVEVLKGIEANIVDYEGNIDLPANYYERMDIILAGFHAVCYPGGTVEQNTRAMIKAIQNPHIDVIVHPGNPEYPINEHEVIEAAVRYSTLIEINNSSLTVSRKGSCKNCRHIAQLAKELGAKVVISSDAHIENDVGNFSTSLEIVQEAGLTEKDIVNSSLDKIREYFRQKGRRRFVEGEK